MFRQHIVLPLSAAALVAFLLLKLHTSLSCWRRCNAFAALAWPFFLPPLRDQACLTTHVKERLNGLSFKDVGEAYKACDCGLLGKNLDKSSLEPMLKVWGQDKYIRADSHFKKVFK